MGEHEHLRLRVIVVSTKAALHSLEPHEDSRSIVTRACDLLAQLELDVQQDGADPVLLSRIAAARQALQEGSPTR